MKTLFKAFVAATALLAFTQVQAADAAVPKYDDPYKMMEVLADKTFQRIARQQADIKKDPEILRTIVTEELVPYIDSRYAAGYVIGNAVKLNTVPKQDFRQKRKPGSLSRVVIISCLRMHFSFLSVKGLKHH